VKGRTFPRKISKQHTPAAVGGSLLDELAREGARQMLAAALQAEVATYIEAHAGELDEAGHRLVVRNGFHEPREVATAARAVPVRQPRVNDKRIDPTPGERMRFSSAILPAWARKSPGVAEVLPLLYLHGLSSGDFVPALEQVLGSAAGLSVATITRLAAPWQDEATAFGKRSLKDTRYVYLWVDGIRLKVRLEQDKVCLLVMIGVRVDGTKELVALADGFRESSESWADLLRDCKRCGMRAPVLAVGDGALGFWNRVTKGPGSRAAGVAMAFKLIESRPGPLTRGQRAPPGRPGPCRSEVRERRTRRTTRRIKRCSASRVTRAAMRPVGMSVSGNFRVRFGCLTGWGCMDGLRHAGWAGR
jgi:Transposase, Mutator family